MNTKTVKKIRKGTKHSFIIFLRKRPRFMPKWIYRLAALIIFNDDGIELIGALYGLRKSVKIGGVKYKIKK